MIPLPIKFTRDDYQCHVRRRDGDIVLIEIMLEDHEHYEVAIVKPRKETRFKDGTVTPAHESLPSNEEWGEMGWSFMDRSSALARFDALAANPPRKRKPR